MIPIGETQDGRADMTNFEMDLFDTRMSNYKADKDEEQCCHSSRNRIIKPACLPITIISLLIITLVFLPLFNEEDLESPGKLATSCARSCKFEMVESMPTGLTYDKDLNHNRTHLEWIDLFDKAERFIDISAMYWNLNSTEYETSIYGRQVYEALIRAGRRGVQVRIAQDVSKGLSDNKESEWLQKNGLAEVRTLNFTRLVGSGILHTKFIIVDLKNVYVGSANMDWKSLSEVKELGAVIRDCLCVATDLYKIFAAYWRLGEDSSRIPPQWPISFRSPYNKENPMPLEFDGQESTIYISSSPQPFNPKGREHDLSAIINGMQTSKKFIYISVMDYLPQTLYMSNRNNSYWPFIDDAIRSAAFNGVEVRLLISNWAHSRESIDSYLKSLLAINPVMTKGTIKARRFTVPADEKQAKIPFARVNHNKYMVTDNTAYIGTSNWAGDYFITTAGVGLSITSTGPNNVRQQLEDIFERDWNSPYAKDV